MDTLPEKLTKPYNPQATEGRIYKKWEESGYFNPDNLPGDRTEAYSMVLPPPNVTGVLHLGHAYENSLQDIFIRYQRMCGKKTLWLPGTDSAAISTQARVEKNIKKEEGLTRHDLGRTELVKRVSTFAKNSENSILNQVRQMGSSLDWSRYAYTLDKKRYRAVLTAFQRMYKAGLIYRSNRIVNWDPKGQTTISDDEIIHQEREAKFYTFKYAKDFPITIATTRPETKVGDTAVAVHPDDKRYQQYIGKEFELIFCDVPLKIKIIADKAVDPEWGTGAIGITPAHSLIDWEIADRHNLPRPTVINEYAKMTVAGRLHGLKTNQARTEVVTWLKENNLLEKEENIIQNISLSERTEAIIEPLPKLQWWVAVNKEFTIPYSEIPGIESGSQTTLKEIMKKSVANRAISMPQNRFQKIYFHWIDNLKDWCISRQIWFGHRIPVWYKNDQIYCGLEAPQEDGWQQEEDVLDTWFSSALWTFSTLGWPEETEDLKTYHPTALISPAYEILPLWISRMILMSGFHLGQVPFKKILIHGLIKDKQGRKFSKSLGNGVDPLEMIEKYGADALRVGLISGTTIGGDNKFDENKIKGYKHFANKIWNISRFVLSHINKPEDLTNLNDNDNRLLIENEKLIQAVTSEMDNDFQHLAFEKLYQYIWHRLADEILEESKEIFKNNKTEEVNSRQNLLLKILKNSIIILHPFMPFVTEELWSILPKNKVDQELLIIQPWPSSN
ncbi:MAG: valine--tRNA ligase [Patescibacteria group bacterium]